MKHSIPLALFLAPLALLVASSAQAAPASDVVCNGCVGSTDLLDKSVTTAKLKGDAVTSTKIKDGAVTGPKIAPAAIEAAHLAPGAAPRGASIGYPQTQMYPLANAGAQLSNVVVNGTAPVGTGSTFDVTLDYSIRDELCLGCIDQIQVGFADGDPQTCVYSGAPGAVGESGTVTVTLTAPATPGTYFLAFNVTQEFGCVTTWTPPGHSQYFAVVPVYQAN